MSLPAIRAVRERYPNADIAVLARPWVAGLYARESSISRVLSYTPGKGFRDFGAKRSLAAKLRAEDFDSAILLQNAFDAALLVWMARIPRRIGYNRDGRGWLLTDAVPVPQPGEIPRHERFYYLELLRRAGVLHALPPIQAIRLDGIAGARADGIGKLSQAGISPPVIGVSPGAAYGNAKRWLPERFAAAASAVAREHGAAVALFGSAGERELCGKVAREIEAAGVVTRNFAGETTLAEFVDLAAACRLFLTNDSGAMHIASALGIPTVAVFGATDHVTTGPTGPSARVVREQVECSPCLLRECPIDHRCMTRVSVDQVSVLALELWRDSEAEWIPETRS
jgi:heptosyltransferase-2